MKGRVTATDSTQSVDAYRCARKAKRTEKLILILIAINVRRKGKGSWLISLGSVAPTCPPSATHHYGRAPGRQQTNLDLSLMDVECVCDGRINHKYFHRYMVRLRTMYSFLSLRCMTIFLLCRVFSCKLAPKPRRKITFGFMYCSYIYFFWLSCCPSVF